MHRQMARYYTVASGDPYKFLTCVPMGASVAPAIGQAATLSLILYKERADEDDLGVVFGFPGGQTARGFGFGSRGSPRRAHLHLFG